MRLFSRVSVIFTVVQNELMATSSQNEILNNFEEYINIYLEKKSENIINSANMNLVNLLPNLRGLQ